jgi:hypothetical protein
MSRNYQSSDEFRREDQRLCRQIDARAERAAAAQVRDAAPDLLEALKLVLPLLAFGDEVSESALQPIETKARAAIALAEGRTA